LLFLALVQHHYTSPLSMQPVCRLLIVFCTLLAGCVLAGLASCSKEPALPAVPLQLNHLRLGGFDLSVSGDNAGAPFNQPLNASFSAALDPATVQAGVVLSTSDGTRIPLAFSFFDDGRTFSGQPEAPIRPGQLFQLQITSSLRGRQGEVFPGITLSFTTRAEELQVIALAFDGTGALAANPVTNIARAPRIEITFSHPISQNPANGDHFRITGPAGLVPSAWSLSGDGRTVTLQPQTLAHLSRHQLWILSDLSGAAGEVFSTFTKTFFTVADNTPKFPVISDDELLTLVQRQTFRYFFDFAHPHSGMARERNTSGDLVTAGGSGFGIMALIVGMERGFISRAEGLARLNRILTFLETCDRFHGAWPHWMNGNTGRTIPFSANDDGADLVETSFVIQGLLTMRQYLTAAEQPLIDRINALWHAVQWTWFTRGGQNVLYWHWSPGRGWAMNMTITGYNECLITYVLAAASPTHPISQAVYVNGWARQGAIRNNRLFYNIRLPLGYDYGGPLFFAHYSFLGLNPTRLQDQYANYWDQNVNHTLINRAYCIANPRNFAGYSAQNWGLTASDNHFGYSAHSPTNDLGVIAPTAALSSMPFTPQESMEALRFFYYTLGDRLWGPYGFYDAFSIHHGWTANSYLAIDQGPIVVMIENYRTGLLWNLFMSAPEVQAGLGRLGFTIN
jgi:hypothetical protein